MHTETFGYAPLTQVSAASGGLFRRVAARVRASLTVKYELDDHLARDIGASSYRVPLIGAARQGDAS